LDPVDDLECRGDRLVWRCDVHVWTVERPDPDLMLGRLAG
jgi:hypothetical protein